MEEGCCVSAPGKVLVAGGYLVTLRPHPGLVFSVSARLYAAVRPAAAPASSPATLNGGADPHEFGLVVDSPQFRKTFRFSAALADGTSEPHLLLRNLCVLLIYFIIILHFIYS
jgi:phosphomevalonate kinase